MFIKHCISFIFLLSIVISVSFAQNCHKKKFCDKNERKDYDYRSQSSYHSLSSGDTLNINVVAYNKQAYHLLACSDPKLGPLNIQVVYPKKRVERYIKEIVPNQNNPSRKDTIWSNKVVTEYELLFDNSEDKSLNYWEFSSRKTRLLIINITAPEGKANYTGCANILLGHKLMSATHRRLR